MWGQAASCRLPQSTLGCSTYIRDTVPAQAGAAARTPQIAEKGYKGQVRHSRGSQSLVLMLVRNGDLLQDHLVMQLPRCYVCALLNEQTQGQQWHLSICCQKLQDSVNEAGNFISVR